VLSHELLTNPRLDVTLAVNGYDDGLSTGEIRRFLGDCLGPSDYRKNAARLARQLGSCDERLVDLLELRLPQELDAATATLCMQALCGESPDSPAPIVGELAQRSSSLESPVRQLVAEKIRAFEQERESSGKSFNYADCSVGNILFAGCFLTASRSFNRALADYCDLVGLPPGMLENVTDGTDAFLAALNVDGELLVSEADVVDATRCNQIDEIFLVGQRMDEETAEAIRKLSPEQRKPELQRRSVVPPPNPDLLQKIRRADLIVYSPGTQHSSLFPSYLTPEIGAAIAGNLEAIKLLITNLEEDADLAGMSAARLVDVALYYLRDKNRRPDPAPSLITHYLIHDPVGAQADSAAYLPLGSLDNLRDPRSVRIADFESGEAGRHDAAKLLQPYIDAVFERSEKRKVAVLLQETRSADKISQTMIELVRAGVERLPYTLEVFYSSSEDFESSFKDSLPFAVRNLDGVASVDRFRSALADEGFEYVVLFDSSGMYKGEDILNMLLSLRRGRHDAIWGSRRLSVNDIRMAYRLLHRSSPISGMVSYLGSHVLSLGFLLGYGRYISDTLSGAKVIRTPYLLQNEIDPGRPGSNFEMLSVLLRDRAEVFETPVHYLPIAPDRVRRTTMVDGLRAVWTIVAGRFRPIRYRTPERQVRRRRVSGSVPS